MSPPGERPSDVQAKAKYHHGDLRGALILAARQLVEQKGAENFSLADACRLAGVSTAAPYRHFRDRDEILAEVTASGFELLSDSSMAAVAEKGVGTLDGIVAMGHAYVKFAVENQAVFRLMFGQNPAIKGTEPVTGEGQACFGKVIEQVAIYCEKNRVPGDAAIIAVKLWTFVHGAASLLIDEDYEKVAPGIDVWDLIEKTTPGLLGK